MSPRSRAASSSRVIVVGAGPAGLSTAAELVARGVATTVLDRGGVGAAWASRYDALRLNTSRRRSALPGAPFPRAFGQFPTRDQYVGYLRAYAADRRVLVETGVRVRAVRPDGRGWVVEDGAGVRRAEHVVVATGAFNVPVVPAWSDAFHGEVVHAARYRSADRFVGRRVVVVGAGSTGMEIADQLARAGAAAVHLAVRTPPNILLRAQGGVPGDLPVPLFVHLPVAVADRVLAGVQRLTVGDLAPYGLPRPAAGVLAQLRDRGAGTAIVDAEVLESIRSGAVTCVPAVTGVDGHAVLLADGSRVVADAVVLATGFRTGLETLVGGLEVLDDAGMPLAHDGPPSAPGLWFVGYVRRPGIVGYVGRRARRVARAIAGGAADGSVTAREVGAGV